MFLYHQEDFFPQFHYFTQRILNTNQTKARVVHQPIINVGVSVEVTNAGHLACLINVANS